MEGQDIQPGEPVVVEMPAGETPPTAADKQPEKTFTQSEFESALKARLERERKKSADAIASAQTEAQRKAAEEQGKFEELYKTTLAEKQALEAQVQEAQLRDMRRKVTVAAGLPEDFTDRIKGDTEEDMTNDAKALAALWRKANAQKVNNDAGNGLGGKAPSTLDVAGAAKRFNLPHAAKALEKAGN